MSVNSFFLYETIRNLKKTTLVHPSVTVLLSSLQYLFCSLLFIGLCRVTASFFFLFNSSRSVHLITVLVQEREIVLLCSSALQGKKINSTPGPNVSWLISTKILCYIKWLSTSALLQVRFPVSSGQQAKCIAAKWASFFLFKETNHIYLMTTNHLYLLIHLKAAIHLKLKIEATAGSLRFRLWGLAHLADLQ